MGVMFDDLLYQLRAVSLKQFGEGVRSEILIKKIGKELEEVRANPNDLEEWIDVIILALDGYWRHGGANISRDMGNKLKTVAKRTYEQQEDGTFQHVAGQD